MLRLWTVTAALLVASVASMASAQCPWSRKVATLQGSCACSYNLAQELTLQCHAVDFSALIGALQQYASDQTIDLLYVHNSSVVDLRDGIFQHVTINNLQLSGCNIRRIAAKAFQGQEQSLKNLNLQDNLLSSVPVAALRSLKNLALVDLSSNRIAHVADESFSTLPLTTLKLADNNLTLAPNAFSGLESTLKNLNLKGTQQRGVPTAVTSLASLAFLDLAQNDIERLDDDVFERLTSLTALNLERNALDDVSDDAFNGVNDTLSSLSLLNNVMTTFPTRALAQLTKIRVLDVGFNLMTSLPVDAFRSMKMLTLLALDGNPLATLRSETFAHLNGSLRGLSLGGSALHCDCNLRWIATWIRDSDLQVTSRERSPQFCGSPPALRPRSFYQLAPQDFKCADEADELENETDDATPTTPRTTSTTAATEEPEEEPEPEERPEVLKEDEDIGMEMVAMPPLPSTVASVAKPQTEQEEPTTSRPATTSATRIINRGSIEPEPMRINQVTNRQGGSGSVRKRPTSPTPTPPPPTMTNRRPNLITGGGGGGGGGGGSSSSMKSLLPREVVVKDSYRQDTSVVIQWESESSNILGFRVVYRLFGDDSFQPGPPLDPSAREFIIKNVPHQESLVVCVVSLEDSNVTPETVPFPQCREIRMEEEASSHMDKIIIAASAAICATVIIAVVIFICCNRKRSATSEKLHLNNVLQPNNGSGAAGSMRESQMRQSLATLQGLGLTNAPKDWDQLSMYSSRSIPRARMYHSERPGSVMGSVNGAFIGDDARSHMSGYSLNKAGGMNLMRSRSLAEGQSQRAMSAMSGRYLSSHPLHHLNGMNGMMGSINGLAGMPGMPGIPGMAGLTGMGAMPGMAGMVGMAGMGLSRAGSATPLLKCRHNTQRRRTERKTQVTPAATAARCHDDDKGAETTPPTSSA